MSGRSAAAKSKSKGKGGNGQTWKAKFVNYKLTSEDIARLNDMALSDTQLIDWQNNCAEQGYKISLRMDGDEGHYTASLYDTDQESGFHEFSLTARGSDPRNAWKSLYYKHEIIFERTWVNDRQAMEDYG